MSKSWELYALHVLDAIAKIRRIEATGDLVEDEILYDAALRNLQTLSEATRHFPESVRQNHPSIPWKQISGFRNILVHDYLGDIDPQTIKRIINEHLVPLEGAVKAMLANPPT